MEVAITIVALLLVFCVALGVYATTKAVRAAKRGVDRTISQARRTVEHTTLRARTLAQPGPTGELAGLRLKLRTSMRATQDALHAGVTGDQSLKESLALFERLSTHGRELDDELKRLETEPDRSRLAGRLPDLRERTEKITQSADSLRWAAQDRARRFAHDDLESLNAQIDIEAGALRHWTTGPASGSAAVADASGRQPSGSAPMSSAPMSSESVSPGPMPSGPASAPPRPSSAPGPAQGAPSWPEAPASDAGALGGQTWPDGTERAGVPEPPATGEAARSAIAPPGRRPTYPWQKKSRPETTT
ncbi:hypothetical protein OK074_7828 [Actinobacteria bacterium OK074]|nr:hypothetical protein OK074_7828 [Actinobacteria bacterium OK074]